MSSLFLACPNSAYEAYIRHAVGGPMWTINFSKEKEVWLTYKQK